MTDPTDENLEGDDESGNGDHGQAASRRDVRRRRQARNRWLITGAIVVVIVVIGLVLVPWLTSLAGSDNSDNSDNAATSEPTTTERNPNPGIDGIIATGLTPQLFEPGDCLTDFTSVGEPATVIECDQPHEAELVGRQTFAKSDSYPGTEQMRAAAEEFCGSVPLTGTAQAPVVIQVSNPSEGSWADGDRRVDCLATTTEGTLNEALVEEPTVEDAAAQPSGSASAESSEPAEAEGEESGS